MLRRRLHPFGWPYDSVRSVAASCTTHRHTSPLPVHALRLRHRVCSGQNPGIAPTPPANRESSSSSARCLQPPREGSNARLGRSLRKTSRTKGVSVLLIGETFRDRNTGPAGETLTCAPGLHVRGTRWLAGSKGHLRRLRWPVLEQYRSRTEIVAWAADNWPRACAWAQRHNLPLLRYADPARDPKEHLREFRRRCDLPFHRRMLNHRDRLPGLSGEIGLLELLARPISIKSTGKWNELPPAQQRIVKESCAAPATAAYPASSSDSINRSKKVPITSLVTRGS